nr:hypothetical protein Iba_chr04cCG13700 [Ipomoea batatas]
MPDGCSDGGRFDRRCSDRRRPRTLPRRSARLVLCLPLRFCSDRIGGYGDDVNGRRWCSCSARLWRTAVGGGSGGDGYPTLLRIVVLLCPARAIFHFFRASFIPSWK